MIVIVDVPSVAVLLAVNVKTLVAVAGFVPNAAATPVGMPDADKVTLPVKAFLGVIVMVLVPLDPVAMERLVGNAERLKSGVADPSVKVAVDV